MRHMRLERIPLGVALGAKIEVEAVFAFVYMGGFELEGTGGTAHRALAFIF